MFPGWPAQAPYAGLEGSLKPQTAEATAADAATRRAAHGRRGEGGSGDSVRSESAGGRRQRRAQAKPAAVTRKRGAAFENLLDALAASFDRAGAVVVGTGFVCRVRGALHAGCVRPHRRGRFEGRTRLVCRGCGDGLSRDGVGNRDARTDSAGNLERQDSVVLRAARLGRADAGRGAARQRSIRRSRSFRRLPGDDLSAGDFRDVLRQPAGVRAMVERVPDRVRRDVVRADGRDHNEPVARRLDRSRAWRGARDDSYLARRGARRAGDAFATIRAGGSGVHAGARDAVHRRQRPGPGERRAYRIRSTPTPVCPTA